MIRKRRSVLRVTPRNGTLNGMQILAAIPIERKIREIAEVKDIRTLVIEGSLIIYVDLKDETGNVQAAWQRLRDKMDDVKIELPDGAIGPFVNSDFGDVSIATVAITAEGFSHREMKDVADDFRKKLYQLNGVAKVEASRSRRRTRLVANR